MGGVLPNTQDVQTPPPRPPLEVASENKLLQSISPNIFLFLVKVGAR